MHCYAILLMLIGIYTIYLVCPDWVLTGEPNSMMQNWRCFEMYQSKTEMDEHMISGLKMLISYLWEDLYWEVLFVCTPGNILVFCRSRCCRETAGPNEFQDCMSSLPIPIAVSSCMHLATTEVTKNLSQLLQIASVFISVK